jgi:hypothetical protein
MPRCLLLATMVAVLVAASGCSSCRREPDVAPEAYREAVTAFYVGLAAMQTTQEVLARSKFDRVVDAGAGRSGGMGQPGLCSSGSRKSSRALRSDEGRELAPDSAAIQRLLALAESRRGNLTASWHTGAGLSKSIRTTGGGLLARARDRAAGRRRAGRRSARNCSRRC